MSIISVGENEKITNITGYAPYWTNTNLLNFVNNSHQIPFDAHLNAALVAPVSVRFPSRRHTLAVSDNDT